MIFLTVGTQGPFDRLVRVVDNWAGTRGRTDVHAQIGKSRYSPAHIAVTDFMTPEEFREKIRTASLIVSHAGMGTIITALEFGKPIIVLPRRGDLKEHRNDHQISTAGQLALQGRVVAAVDEADLIRKLDQVETLGEMAPIVIEASPHLIATISAFIAQEPLPASDPAGIGLNARPNVAE